MSVIKVCVLAVVGVILITVIKAQNSAYATLLGVALVGVVLVGAVPDIKALADVLTELEMTETFSAKGLDVIFKVFAILVTGSVCSDICRDNGESAVAGAVEISSKLAAIVCALPVMQAVVSLAASFLKG